MNSGEWTEYIYLNQEERMNIETNVSRLLWEHASTHNLSANVAKKGEPFPRLAPDIGQIQ